MKILVLTSGGLKSLFLTAMAVKEVGAGNVKLLHCNWPSKVEKQQVASVMLQAAHYKVPVHRLSMPKYDKQPFKLTLQLWHALVYAQKYDYGLIYYGATNNWSNPEYSSLYANKLKALTELIQPDPADGLKVPKICIEAPFSLISLTDALVLAIDYDLPWEKTWSCEHSRICHECRSCRERKAAFLYLQMDDPLIDLERRKYARIRARETMRANNPKH